MSTALLSRRRHDPPPGLPILGEMSLQQARVHEFCGPARRMLALAVARAMSGPVFWIRPGWTPEELNPDGFLKLINPGRLTFITARRAEDLLWSMEECLRAGAVPLVVAELPEPPPLTPVRRLHLAAETGAAAGVMRPLGLMLTPGEGGAPGVESRWHLAPRHADGTTAWRLERRRARTAPPRDWVMRMAGGKLSLDPPDRAEAALTTA